MALNLRGLVFAIGVILVIITLGITFANFPVALGVIGVFLIVWSLIK